MIGHRRYEVAYKDLTQPRMCRCTTSYKKTLPDKRQLADTFSIQCPPESTTYAEALVFNLTDQPGVLLGSWTNLPRASQIVFPDMVRRGGGPSTVGGVQRYR